MCGRNPELARAGILKERTVMTTHVVADGVTKRKPTLEEMEILLVNRIPDLVRRFKEGGLDPAGANATLQMVAEGTVITEEKKVIVVPPKPKKEKFALLADLGIITVPDDYDHRTWLERFKAKHQSKRPKNFCDYDDAITDTNFAMPSRVLKPGDKLMVFAYRQTVGGMTTSEERMRYLETQNTDVYPGAQGASLVFDEKCNQLPKDYGYASFDKVENLPFLDGHHMVPRVGASSGGGFGFNLGSFERVWSNRSAFFGFREISA
jgi:hypothetical protein